MAAKKKVSKKVTKKAAKKVANKVTSKATVNTAPKKKAKATKKVTKKVSKKSASSKAKSEQVANSSADRLQDLQDLLQENLKGINTDKAEAIAKNIWLAGLGAYARTFNEVAERVDDLQDRYESINSDGQKVFDELIERGEGMQQELEDTVQKGKANLEARVEEFKERFGGGLSSFVDIPGRLRDAAEKIEELSEKLQKK